MGSKRIGRTPRRGLTRDAARWTQGDPLAGRMSSQREVGTFSWDWDAEPWKTDDINYGSRKKHQARVMEHVSVKPNERRKKLSLLQMQRGKVNKCRQIWQGSHKCKEIPFVLILFPFARCHVCWCMQTCNVYMDSTIIFYFLFCRDSSITLHVIFNQGE